MLRVLPPTFKPVLQQIRLLTGLNVGGHKTLNTAIGRYLTRFAGMLQSKLPVFPYLEALICNNVVAATMEIHPIYNNRILRRFTHPVVKVNKNLPKDLYARVRAWVKGSERPEIYCYGMQVPFLHRLLRRKNTPAIFCWVHKRDNVKCSWLAKTRLALRQRWLLSRNWNTRPQ